jgi:hypothetical protein
MKQSFDFVDIGVFEKLNWVAETSGLSQTEWARAAWPHAKRNQQPRISELKRISEMVQAGITQEEASKRVRRDCTFPKIFALRKGLIEMLGAKAVAKRIEEWEKFTKRKRKKTAPEYEREVNFFFMWCILKDKDKDRVLDLMRDLIDKDKELSKE